MTCCDSGFQRFVLDACGRESAGTRWEQGGQLKVIAGGEK